MIAEKFMILNQALLSVSLSRASVSYVKTENSREIWPRQTPGLINKDKIG